MAAHVWPRAAPSLSEPPPDEGFCVLPLPREGSVLPEGTQQSGWPWPGHRGSMPVFRKGLQQEPALTITTSVALGCPQGLAPCCSSHCAVLGGAGPGEGP